MKETKTVGLGFLDALALLFIALKLTGCISWPLGMGALPNLGRLCAPSFDYRYFFHLRQVRRHPKPRAS